MNPVAARPITVADEVWLATALLHRENPERAEFTIQEIKERLDRERIAGELRRGVEPHIRQHCVANAPPSPNRPRMLFATGTRTRRLFRPGDPYDPRREGGRQEPVSDNLPERYRYLLDWYRSDYAPRRARPDEQDPILSLRGLGKDIWAGEHPDEYVRRLREGWA